MTTYKVQHNKSGWYNLTNIEGGDMEFINIADAKTVSLVYSSYHTKYSALVKDWRIVDSHGNYHTL